MLSSVSPPPSQWLHQLTTWIQSHHSAAPTARKLHFHRTAEANAELLAALAKEMGLTWKRRRPSSSQKGRTRRTTTSKGKKAQKGKKAKKVKDPTKPKGKNAFMLYSAAVRAETKEANPDLKPTEIAKLLGTQWKDLPQERSCPTRRQQQSRERGTRTRWRLGRRSRALTRSSRSLLPSDEEWVAQGN